MSVSLYAKTLLTFLPRLGLWGAFLGLLFCYPLHTAPFRTIGVLVKGESFRLGEQGSRDTGGEGSVQLQERAALSLYAHVIDVWRSLGYEVRVFLDTYPCQGLEQTLPDLFQTSSLNVRTMDPHLLRNIRRAFSLAYRENRDIDAWFITRFDILYKPAFEEIAKRLVSEQKRILAPWQISPLFGAVLYSGHPRSCDTMHWVPQSLAGDFLDALRIKQPNLHALWDMVNSYVREHHLGYMVEGEAYDSDPSKERNPYYSFVQRKEAGDPSP